jgi:general secretion pathway protein D
MGQGCIHPYRQAWTRLAMAAALALTAAGCMHAPMVSQSEQLLAAKDWEGAVRAAQQATLQQPANPEARAQLRRAIDQAVSGLLMEAAPLRETQPQAAAALYARVLSFEPFNQRAIAGYRALEAENRRASALAEASRALQAGRTREARRRLQALLAETPDDARARALLKTVEEAAIERMADPVPSRLAEAYRTKVTLEFREASIQTVFEILSRETGLNFMFDKDLNRATPVSIFARQTSFGEVLENILATNGLASKVTGNDTLLIYTASQQKLREYQELLVHNFFLENSDAKQLGAMLKSILKINDLYVDERRNLIVVRDTADVVNMAVRLVAAHDQPEPEVMLDVEILEVKRSALNEIGVRFPDQLTFGVPGDLTVNAARALSGDVFRVNGLDKALILNLKRQVGNTELLANPRIRVRNRERAKIHIGDRVPVITSTLSTVAALSTESVSYLDVGIKLEVEPVIQLDDVQIRASLEVSSIVGTSRTNSGSTVYQIGTRNAATTLTLRDGETQVLAGLIQRSERGNSARLPGVGDLPVVGRLFSSEASDSDKTEVLLSITPYMVRALERPSDALLQFKAGTDGARRAAGTSGTASNSSSPAAPRPPAASTPPMTVPLPTPVPSGLLPPAGGLPARPPNAPAPSPAPAPTPAPAVPAPGSPPGSIPDFEAPPGVWQPRR